MQVLRRLTAPGRFFVGLAEIKHQAIREERWPEFEPPAGSKILLDPRSSSDEVVRLRTEDA